jgi:hypothetical protein
MVVSILAVLTMVVPGMNAQNEETRAAVARKSMQDGDTITNRYLVDMGDLPRANVADSNWRQCGFAAIALLVRQSSSDVRLGRDDHLHVG